MEVQTILNILYYFRCSGCGQCQHRNSGQEFPYFRNFQIGRPEVISPLGDTVTFVYCDHGDFHCLQFGAENLRIHTFRRNIEEFVITEDTILQCGENLLARHAGIYGKRHDSPFAQVLHLIFHQGNEGSNDNANTFLSESRHLEGDGLSTACRHKPQCIFAFADTGNDLLLQVAEGVIPPVLFQYLLILIQSVLYLQFEVGFRHAYACFLRWCSRCRTSVSS